VRHAPPVQVRSHGVGWRALQSLLFALSAAAFATWALLHADWSTWPAGPARWIPLSRRDTGAADHALRVALYARAPVAPDAATELWRSP
jgi:hypothetical protein